MPKGRLLRLVRLAAACAAAGLTAAAVAPRAAGAEDGDDLKVYVLTFGPHEHPLYKFGHNAIVVQRQGGGEVFDFGNFAFDQPDLIPKLLRGRFQYWLSVSSVAETLHSYQAANRTIEAQELDLTPAQRWGLLSRLRHNALPENRGYLYDYFWDNCSTRVRDAVDAAVGGQVQAEGAAPGTMTLRDHVLRMTSDQLWEYVGLHFGLGQLTDAPLTVWQEAFLPENLRDLLRLVRIERDGALVLLIKSERVIFTAQRLPPPTRPPRRTPWFTAVGLALGGVMAGLGWLGLDRRAARAALGTLSALLGLVLGTLGLILLLLWAATNHRATHANANILLCAPWAIALLPVGVGVAVGSGGAQRVAFWIAASALALAVAGLAAKVLPGPSQDNAAFLALLLPFWLGLTAGLRQLLPRAR
jgi:hypothetical protein